MNRIVIIGSPGPGKSTLANKMGKLLGRPVVHLDKEYWIADWQKKFTTKESWNELHNNLILQDRWIIDADYENSMEQRLRRADTILFLNPSK